MRRLHLQRLHYHSRWHFRCRLPLLCSHEVVVDYVIAYWLVFNHEVARSSLVLDDGRASDLKGDDIERVCGLPGTKELGSEIEKIAARW